MYLITESIVMEKSFHCQGTIENNFSVDNDQHQIFDRKAFGQRLSGAIKISGLTQKALGASIGKSEKIIGAWIQGKYVPTLEDATLISSILKVDLNILAFGISAVVSIPFWGNVSAGLGYQNINMYPEWFLEIDPQIVRSQFRANPESTHLAQVEGESMAPQFFDGDLIFVDTSDIEPVRGVYVFRIGNECLVKQVAKTKEGLTVTSINPEYHKSNHTYRSDSEVEEIVIIGRVKGKIARV
jgi:SOS-response transcriptional repressor LexA